MGTSSADPIAALALGLALILTVAKFAGHAALRLGAPAVLGELLAGIALGSLPFTFVHDLAESAGIDVFARFGAMILVFEVGLQLTIREVFEVGVPSILVAVAGTAFTFVAGWGASVALLRGAPASTAIFLGAAVTATSIGITARVLKDLGRTRTREARIILGAAVLDDVIGLVVLTVVSGYLVSGAAAHDGPSIVVVIGKTVVFLGLALLLGARFSPKMFELAARLKSDGALMAVGLSFCFFLAWAASMVGLAAIIGAFTAGLIIEESHSKSFVARGERSLAELVEPLSSFLVPIFFVVMGMRTRVSVFLEPGTLVFALALTAAAVAGKLACAAGAGRGTNRLAVAIGMMPRGEVCLVYASLGFLDAKAYSSLVMVVVATTLVTPAALKWSFRRGESAAAPTARADAA